MADRYQGRPFPADDDKGESDPLAELARLIGQTDPFGTVGRTNPKVQPRSAPALDPYRHQPPPAVEDDAPAGPPPWMQRANRQEIKKPAYEEPEQDEEPLPEQGLSVDSEQSEGTHRIVLRGERIARAEPDQRPDRPLDAVRADLFHDPRNVGIRGRSRLLSAGSAWYQRKEE